MVVFNVNEEIDRLLLKGESITFAGNSITRSHGTYGMASSDFRTWVALIENLIIENYGESSSPFKLFSKFNIDNIDGYEVTEFNKHKSILIGALNACKGVKPKKRILDFDNAIALSNIFNRFHSVVIQLRNRYNSRETLDVNDEYDVQDLLHCLLRLHFKDIRKEEWTPSYAGGSARMDFLLKEEDVVIEVKKTRAGLDDKILGKQLIEDRAKYSVHPNCKKLICFTYDPEGRILNPKGLQNDLNSTDKDFTIEIVIKPDHQ